jgi:hypothetical protein
MIYGRLICFSGHVRSRRASRCGTGSTSFSEIDTPIVTLNLVGHGIGVWGGDI